MQSRSRFDIRDPRLNFYCSPRAVFGSLRRSKSDSQIKRRKKLKAIMKRRSPNHTRSKDKTQKLPNIATRVKAEPLPFIKAKVRSPKSRFISTPPGLGYRPPFHIQTPAGTPSKYTVSSTSYYYETPTKNRAGTASSGRARWTVPTKSSTERRRYQEEELRDFWSRRNGKSQGSPNKRRSPLSPQNLGPNVQRPLTSPFRGRKITQTRLGTATTTFNFGRSPLPFERRRLIQPD